MNWNPLKYRAESLFRYLFNPHSLPTFERDILERGKYGYSHRDCWNLDEYLTQIMISSLRYFRNLRSGIPSSLYIPCGTEEGEREWDAILDKIISGLQDGLDASNDCANSEDVRYRNHKEALKLLTKYWWDLWY
jgi:hypothetical protein